MLAGRLPIGRRMPSCPTFSKAALRSGQRGEQLQNIGGAVKAGLTARIEFPETQFQYPRELLLARMDLRCQIVRKAQSDRGHLPEV
jgi:hypothetical protein